MILGVAPEEKCFFQTSRCIPRLVCCLPVGNSCRIHSSFVIWHSSLSVHQGSEPNDWNWSQLREKGMIKLHVPEELCITDHGGETPESQEQLLMQPTDQLKMHKQHPKQDKFQNPDLYFGRAMGHEHYIDHPKGIVFPNRTGRLAVAWKLPESFIYLSPDTACILYRKSYHQR